MLYYTYYLSIVKWNGEKKYKRKKNLIIFYACFCLWTAFCVSFMSSLESEQWTPNITQEPDPLEHISNALYDSRCKLVDIHLSFIFNIHINARRDSSLGREVPKTHIQFWALLTLLCWSWKKQLECTMQGRIWKFSYALSIKYFFVRLSMCQSLSTCVTDTEWALFFVPIIFIDSIHFLFLPLPLQCAGVLPLPSNVFT